MIPELRYLSYDERLIKCGLTTLNPLRLRGDVFSHSRKIIELDDIR